MTVDRQVLSVRNRQRSQSIDLRLLWHIVQSCLRDILCVSSFELSIQIVATAEMTRCNEQYLRHGGSTDVITFDYRENPRYRKTGPAVFGDILVCIEEAILQAKRFRTSWQQELVRYIVHGVLHLLGYDDRTAALRRKMKQAEDKVVADLAARFRLTSLHRARKAHG